ncbi:hypothetical protein VE02_00300 [Pseudogymnoascus sp. 03VT05]|nr:hypothetical protein VE02_00300 [Pseudogymnoascus sp. 03VT05]
MPVSGYLIRSPSPRGVVHPVSASEQEGGGANANARLIRADATQPEKSHISPSSLITSASRSFLSLPSTAHHSIDATTDKRGLEVAGCAEAAWLGCGAAADRGVRPRKIGPALTVQRGALSNAVEIAGRGDKSPRESDQILVAHQVSAPSIRLSPSAEHGTEGALGTMCGGAQRLDRPEPVTLILTIFVGFSFADGEAKWAPDGD